ncbi:MAG: FAD binding domain-containing protein, partial [Deltaproteobacteria bacterium]|nr:FAD binding domain-containing protein [Deltaproteobacteria bacterium]
MAIIQDMMPAFELFQPASISDAVGLLNKYGKEAWVLGGGMDSLDWFKDRVKRPKMVVDLGQIKELKGIRQQGDGVEIGAMTTLTQVSTNSLIQSRYALLAQAARKVATPQIRNQGTIGGNVSQDTRCWYYRDGMPCYRAGGNACYADTPTAMNREHCLFEADRCVAVSPSDTAPALIALDAKFVIRSSKGERVVDAEDFFIGPEVDITRMTILKPGDLLTEIR